MVGVGVRWRVQGVVVSAVSAVSAATASRSAASQSAEDQVEDAEDGGGAAQVRGEGHRQDRRDAEAEGQLHRGGDGGGDGGGGGGGDGGGGGVEEMLMR